VKIHIQALSCNNQVLINIAKSVGGRYLFEAAYVNDDVKE